MLFARAGVLVLLVSAFTLPAQAISQKPRLNFDDRVNPAPRPYDSRTDVTRWTSLYFEVIVPDQNGPVGAVDTDSIEAWLIPSGGAPVQMVQAGRVFLPGFSGRFVPGIDSGQYFGDAVYIAPDAPLDANRTYTVRVVAETLDNVSIHLDWDEWDFTTRPVISNPAVSWNVDLAGPTVHWEGWFFTGILKPDFNTSRLFDQLDSYALMDTVNAINPDAFSLQRDWPLTSDYWHNGVFDGNPNIVREIETRQITAVTDQTDRTVLTVTDLEEGPLYGIAPGRPLSPDYQPGDQITVADRTKYEPAQVLAVNDVAGTVEVTKLTNPAASWEVSYAGSHPPDLPETPDNFTLPLCYLRKLSPVGTPVYYWARVNDEWDIVHVQHGRRLQVNFSYTPLDLSSEPVPGSTGGHGSISPPKDWDQWHEFVRTLTFHLIDRYGAATEDWYWSVGNENNFSIFWSGGKDGFYELYDYTVNAVLTAFEDRGLDANTVQVGGIEAAFLGGQGWMRDAMYHCSGATDRPGGGIAEQNFVCSNPAFDTRRAARVNAICTAHADKGSPLDFISIHEYRHADEAVSSLTGLRDDALSIDPVFYDALNVTSFETTPDWIPRPDPASRWMHKGNGYLPTWMAEWMQRMVDRAESDSRYARHEAVLTVWPFDYNGQGISSWTGLIRMDDDSDGTEDRVATIRKAVFNYTELVASMNRDLDALPAQSIEGIRFGGVRSPDADVHRILVYNHDKYDTEASDETAFTANLTLTNVPWPNATVRRWRVDRDHSSPHNAYKNLPERATTAVYTPAEVAPLEASDDLVEDGSAQDYAAPAGSFALAVPLRVNGVALVEIRERDLDGDGFGDTADCASSDPFVWAAPGVVTGVTFSVQSAGTLDWTSQAATAGPATVYDLSDGLLSSLAASGDYTGAGCLLAGAGEPPLVDPGPAPPPGDGRWVLLRARNGCGSGSYGSGSAGPRSVTACP